MAKLRDIAAGTRAVRHVTLPLVNVRSDLLPDLPELAEARAADRQHSGQSDAPGDCVVGLRVLTGDEYALVLERARQFATARGSADPKPGDPLYDYGEMVHRVVLAAVDPDSDPTNPEPFFASTDELMGSPHVGRDGIILLAEQHETWQDLCSPRSLTLSTGQLIEFVGKVAAADTPGDFFEQLRPGTLWIFLRILVVLLRSSPTHKWLFGSTSESDTTSSSSPASEP